MWRCSNCRGEVHEGDVHCSQCGARLDFAEDPPLPNGTWSCSNCGTSVTLEDRHCAHCGRRLDFGDDKPGSLWSGNGLAVAGMVLGIASVFLSFIGIVPILAIIFSGLGLAKTAERGGRGQAWTGLVLGILFTLVYLNQYGHLG